MVDLHNIFISHYGEDEIALDKLKARLRANGCDVRNSSVEKKKYRPGDPALFHHSPDLRPSGLCLYLTGLPRLGAGKNDAADRGRTAEEAVTAAIPAKA